MDTNVSAYAEVMVSMLKKGNAVNALSFAKDFHEKVIEDVNYAVWITEPANLKTVHEAIIDNYPINPKLLMLKNRIGNRHRRGHMVMLAIVNALTRVAENEKLV